MLTRSSLVSSPAPAAAPSVNPARPSREWLALTQAVMRWLVLLLTPHVQVTALVALALALAPTAHMPLLQAASPLQRPAWPFRSHALLQALPRTALRYRIVT